MIDLIDVVAVACEKMELIEGATPRFVMSRNEPHARAELEDLILQAERMEGVMRRCEEQPEYEWQRAAYRVGRYLFVLVNYEDRWSIQVQVGLTKEGIRRFYFGEMDGGD